MPQHTAPEEQINRVNEYSRGFLLHHAIGDQVDNELDKATLYGLLEKVAWGQEVGAPRELYKILSGELDGYLSGDVTEDVLIEHLENRVGLYLSEQK